MSSLICHICFSTDVKMFRLQKKLLAAYNKITDECQEITKKHKIHLCYICRKLLIKYTAFQKKCVAARNQLNSINNDEKLVNVVAKPSPLLDIGPIITNKYDGQNIDSEDDDTPLKMLKIEELNTCDDDDAGLYPSDSSIKIETDEQNCKAPSTVKEDRKKKKLSGKKTKEKKRGRNVKIKSEFENGLVYRPPVRKKMNRKELLESIEGFATLVYYTYEEQIAEIHKRKESLNYKGAGFRCEHCFKGFITKKSYENHMRQHSATNGEYICDICKIRCRKKTKLSVHINRTHAEAFHCKFCSKVTYSVLQARLHKDFHEGATYPCQYCGKTFKHVQTYYTHVRMAHRSQFICSDCGKSFVSDVGLHRHKMKAHPSATELPALLRDTAYSPEPNLVIQDFFCRECNMDFKNEEAFKIHLVTSANHNEGDGCRNCGQTFETQELQRRHKCPNSRFHEKPVQPDVPLPRYQCDLCPRTYKTPLLRNTHMKAFHMGMSLPKAICRICNVEVPNKYKLQCHLRMHTGDKLYACEVCGNTFRQRSLLEVHQRGHFNIKPFACTYCSKKFAQKCALTTHMRVHTGEKPYECHMCLKRFTQSCSLKLHINTVHFKLPAPYKRKRKNNKDEKEDVY